MGKRAAVITVIILISGLAVLGYFLQQGRKSLLTDPYRSVTPSAAIIIESIDLKSFVNSLTTGQGLFGEVAKIGEFENFNRKLKFLADQLNKPPYQDFLDGSRAVISFHPAGSGKVRSLLTLAVKSDIRLRQIREALRSAGIININDTILAGIKALCLPFVNGTKKDTVFVTNSSGLLLFSTSRDLLEKSVKQTGSDSDVRDMPGFARVFQSSGKNEDKIFIIFSNLPGMLGSVLKGNNGISAEKAGKLAGTTGCDIFINDKGLVLSGYTESLGSEDILQKFKSGPAAVFSTYKILPAATTLFESVVYEPSGQRGINPGQSAEGEAGPAAINPERSAEGEAGPAAINPERSAKSENGPAGINPLQSVQGEAVTAGSRAGRVPPLAADLAAALRDYTGDEITKAYIDIRGNPVKSNSLIIYELKNRVYAEKIFLDKFNPLINENNVLYFRPDDQVNIPVYMTPFRGYVSAFLENYQGEHFDSCFAFYDNYLITGSSYSTISRLLYDNILNKTLANDLVYRDFESSLPSTSGYFFYCVPSGITTYLSGYLADDIIKGMRENRNSLGKIQAAGIQLTPSNNMIYNSLSVQFRDVIREESLTEWETLLDTIAAVKPFFFRNHITGATEIFIQDMKNNAYLINAAGRVLWKVPLQERITGSVYMIDYFKNGKYQLLFSGRNYLHLLDRNGNYVERYPVRLRSPATNALALFDYDNNRNYRLLIAGEDRMIYAYDKTGSVVKGWKPFRAGSSVTSEVAWFRVSGKDFLVISDENSVYFLDRTGNKRLTLKEPVTKAPGSSLRLTSGSMPSVVCTSPSGTVQHIYFDGRVEKFTAGEFTPGHSFDIFDVDGDGSEEYIFIDKGKLYLYDNNRSEMFTKQFGSEDLGGPINFVFSSADRKIGVFEKQRQLIYLIDSEGNEMEGFPLKGASMFSVGRLSDDGGWHLIVGGTDRFLYNYKLGTALR